MANNQDIIIGLAAQPLSVSVTNVNADDPITSYSMDADNAVTVNGVTYTVTKDETTGLINKITDSGGNELIPSAADGIADVSLHNAVIWAAAVSRGLGTPYTPDIYNLIVAGEKASWGENFSGFTKSLTNAFSSYWFGEKNGKGYVYFAKDYCINDSQDTYTDSVIYKTTAALPVDKYNKLVIKACLFTNNYGYPDPVLDGCAYITFGDVPDPTESTEYDWTGWQQLITNDELFYAQLDEFDPVKAASTEYVIDISNLTGMQHINIGLWRNDIRSGYSVYLVVSEMYMR